MTSVYGIKPFSNLSAITTSKNTVQVGLFAVPIGSPFIKGDRWPTNNFLQQIKELMPSGTDLLAAEGDRKHIRAGHYQKRTINLCGATGTRTPDPLLAKQVLWPTEL